MLSSLVLVTGSIHVITLPIFRAWRYAFGAGLDSYESDFDSLWIVVVNQIVRGYIKYLPPLLAGRRGLRPV
jgi:hypothetical protein